MVLPHVIHELDPTTSSKDPTNLPQLPFEYTKGQLKKLVNPPTSGGRKIQARRFTHLAPGEERSLPSSFSTPDSGPEGETGPGGAINSVISNNGSKVVTFKHRARDDVEFPQFVTSGHEPEGGRIRGSEVEKNRGVGDVLPEMSLDMRDEEDAEARALESESRSH